MTVHRIVRGPVASLSLPPGRSGERAFRPDGLVGACVAAAPSGFGGSSSSPSFTFDPLATAAPDEKGTVLRWSPSATELLGLTAADAQGRPIRDLAADPQTGHPGGPGGPAG
ncbi:PAS domain S-box protein, partial [Streptomyces phyllanthi]